VLFAATAQTWRVPSHTGGTVNEIAFALVPPIVVLVTTWLVQYKQRR